MANQTKDTKQKNATKDTKQKNAPSVDDIVQDAISETPKTDAPVKQPKTAETVAEDKFKKDLIQPYLHLGAKDFIVNPEDKELKARQNDVVAVIIQKGVKYAIVK